MLASVERNRYADLLRVVAISGVVYGHWLLISVIYRNGQLSGHISPCRGPADSDTTDRVAGS